MELKPKNTFFSFPQINGYNQAEGEILENSKIIRIRTTPIKYMWRQEINGEYRYFFETTSKSVYEFKTYLDRLPFGCIIKDNGEINFDQITRFKSIN
jgi:hypothetical protein